MKNITIILIFVFISDLCMGQTFDLYKDFKEYKFTKEQFIGFFKDSSQTKIMALKIFDRNISDLNNINPDTVKLLYSFQFIHSFGRIVRNDLNNYSIYENYFLPQCPDTNIRSNGRAYELIKCDIHFNDSSLTVEIDTSFSKEVANTFKFNRHKIIRKYNSYKTRKRFNSYPKYDTLTNQYLNYDFYSKSFCKITQLTFYITIAALQGDKKCLTIFGNLTKTFPVLTHAATLSRLFLGSEILINRAINKKINESFYIEK